jgi:hypothetical protein
MLQLYREKNLWSVDDCFKSLMEDGVCDLHMLILVNIVWFVAAESQALFTACSVAPDGLG